MARIEQRRVCAELQGGFVLFLIGMRVNRPWKVWKWLPVSQAMPKMIAELYQNPDLGFLHAQTQFSFPNVTVTQYWKSFEHLEAYAKARDRTHLPAWQAFNRAVGSNGDVGIWHETYIVGPGQYENIYNNMPPYGLSACATVVDAIGARQAARQRVKEAAA